MAKLFSVQTQNTRKGQILGSAWKNKAGFGITLRGKIKNPQGELEDVKDTTLNIRTAKNHYQLQLGNFNPDGNWVENPAKLLMVTNGRKRENSKDPDYIVLGFPKQE